MRQQRHTHRGRWAQGHFCLLLKAKVNSKTNADTKDGEMQAHTEEGAEPCGKLRPFYLTFA